MKIRSRLFYLSIWLSALILGGFILTLPAIVHSDGITTTFSAFQHRGVYLTDDVSTDDGNVQAGDRVVRINDCDIEGLLDGSCHSDAPQGTYKYEIIRAGQSIELNTTPLEVMGEYYRAHVVEIAGFVAMLIGGLMILFHVEKVQWYTNLFALTLFFALTFSFHAVKLPLMLLTRPALFWALFACRMITHATLEITALNLALTYPQPRFRSKRTRQIITGIGFLLVVLVIAGILLFNGTLISGLPRAIQAFRIYAGIILLGIISTFIYHTHNTQRPIINLRLRWIRIGIIVIFLLILLLTALVLVTSPAYLNGFNWSFNFVLEILAHPFTLMLVTAPLFYAIPLAERYPRKIDNIENRFIFYLVLGTLLLLIYAIIAFALHGFNIDRFSSNPYVYLGFALTLTVMLIVAILRRPIDLLINRWFYRDRLKYQTLLPDFILGLSSRLNYDELLLLLLKKLPADFDITSAALVLRDPSGETFSSADLADEPDALQFSKNHPIVQRFAETRKPILRYLDQKLLHPGIIAMLEKQNLEVAFPLTHLGTLVGIYFLREKENHNPYSISEVNVLAELNQWAGTALYNTRVLTEKEDYSRSLLLEMEQQSRELDRVVDETRKFRRSSREFSAQQETILGQAHQDLHEPLEAISELSQALADEHPKSDELSLYIQRLADRLNTFLEYSSLQIETFQTQSTPCDLAQLFETLLSTLEEDIPNIREALSFHIEAHAPMVVNFDHERVLEILTLLVQITLAQHPNQAYVITCRREKLDYRDEGEPIRITFDCKAHTKAIILEQMQVKADQIPLKLELIQLLCRRLGGELRREPISANAEFPFQINLQISLPQDSYPAYMGVNLPFLSGKAITMYECDPYALKRMTLQITSWGMKTTAITEGKDFLDTLDHPVQPELLLINASCLDDNPTRYEKALQNIHTRVVLYRLQQPQNTQEHQTEESPHVELDPADLYNLITRALLFSTTAEQFPHLPRHLRLNPAYLEQTRTVLLVGEHNNFTDFAPYFERLNLKAVPYIGEIDQLTPYVRSETPGAILFELDSKEQGERKVIETIRSTELLDQPFIIAASDNPIRYPALKVLKSGADKYLLKPYTLEELLTLLAEWLNLVNQQD